MKTQVTKYWTFRRDAKKMESVSTIWNWQHTYSFGVDAWNDELNWNEKKWVEKENKKNKKERKTLTNS